VTRSAAGPSSLPATSRARRTSAVLLLAGLLSACQPGQETGTASPPVPAQAPATSPSTTEPALDLSREHLQGVDTSQDGPGVEPEAALPAMFDTPARTKKVKVGGGLLTDEEAETLQDASDGVEFKVEVRTP